MLIELNKTYCGDCLELMRHVPDASVDMVLCDLPYGVTENKWDSIIDPAKLWEAYLRVCKRNAAIVLTATQPFTSALVMEQPKLFKYTWVWVKNRISGFANAKRQPLRATEDVLVFYRSQPVYNPQGIVKMQVGKKIGPRYSRGNDKYDYGNARYGFTVSDRPVSVKGTGRAGALRPVTTMAGCIQDQTNYPRNVLEFASETECHHPTQKPVALFEYLIRTYTNEGDTVLDNTCGSGTTGVACKRSGRNFIQIDMSEKYCAIARKRYEENMWKVPFKMPDGRKRLL